MTNKIPIIVFDFDGTIADTMTVILDIYNTVIAPAFGCKPIADNDHNWLRSLRSASDIMKEYNVTALKLPFMVMRARKELGMRIDEVRVQRGVGDVVRELARKGCTLGILTTNSRSNVERFLKNHGLDAAFDFIYTGKHAFRKHSVLKRLMREKGLAPAQTVLVGDETRDVDAARRAKVKVVAVSWGYSRREALEGCGPDLLIDTPGQLLEMIPLPE